MEPNQTFTISRYGKGKKAVASLVSGLKAMSLTASLTDQYISVSISSDQLSAVIELCNEFCFDEPKPVNRG